MPSGTSSGLTLPPLCRMFLPWCQPQRSELFGRSPPPIWQPSAIRQKDDDEEDVMEVELHWAAADEPERFLRHRLSRYSWTEKFFQQRFSTENVFQNWTSLNLSGKPTKTFQIHTKTKHIYFRYWMQAVLTSSAFHRDIVLKQLLLRSCLTGRGVCQGVRARCSWMQERSKASSLPVSDSLLPL